LYRASGRCKQRPCGLRTSIGIARGFGSGTKVHNLALGESASQLMLVHGFEDEFEFEFEFD
jgi:hypothetical protein